MQRRRAVVFFWFGRNFKNWVSWPQFPCLDLLRFFCGFVSKNSCIEIFVWLADQSWRTICNSEGRNNWGKFEREREREIHAHTYTHKYTHVYPQWAKSILGILNRRVWKSCSRYWEQSVGWVVVVSVRSWQQREVWRVLQLWSWNQGKRKRKRVGVCWTNTKHLEREREREMVKKWVVMWDIFISCCDERKMVVEICFGFWVFCVLWGFC